MPKYSGKEYVVVSIKIKKEEAYELDLFTINNGGNRSEIIRKAIKEYMKNHEKREQK